jgi:hypothetical protein
MQTIRLSGIIEESHVGAARLRLDSWTGVKNPRVVIRNQHDACYSRGSPKRNTAVSDALRTDGLTAAFSVARECQN